MNPDSKSLTYPVVLFDGECNLCNKSVPFVIEHDKQGQFRFAFFMERLIIRYFIIVTNKPTDNQYVSQRSGCSTYKNGTPGTGYRRQRSNYRHSVNNRS